MDDNELPEDVLPETENASPTKADPEPEPPQQQEQETEHDEVEPEIEAPCSPKFAELLPPKLEPTDLATPAETTGEVLEQQPAKDIAGNESEDSEAGQLVIALSPKPAAEKLEEKSPPKKRKRRSTATEELTVVTPRVLPGRMKGKGMAYLLAIEKGGSKRLLAQAQAKVEAQTQAYTASLYAAEKEMELGPDHPLQGQPPPTTPVTAPPATTTPKLRLSLSKKDKTDDHTDKVSSAVKKEKGKSRVEHPRLMPEPPEDESMELDYPTDQNSSGRTTPESVNMMGKRSSPNSKPAPIELKSPLYKIPFDYGWKRELVYRPGAEHKPSKTPVEVLYHAPCGKKLRSARELSEYLSQAGTPLLPENFTYSKGPIGVSGEFETIREAKKRVQEDGEDKSTARKDKAAKKAEADELRHKSLQALRDDLSAVTGEPFGWSAEAGGPEEPVEWLAEGKKGKKSKTGDDKLKVRLWGPKQGSKENEVPAEEHLDKKSPSKCGDTCIRPGMPAPLTCASCQTMYHLDCVYGMTNESLCIACNEDSATSPAVPAKLPKMTPSNNSNTMPRTKRSSTGFKTPCLGLLSLEVINGKRFIAISRGPADTYMEPADAPVQESPKRATSPGAGASTPKIHDRNLFEGSSPLFMQQLSHAYNGLLHVLRFLTVQELLCAARVCKLWRDLALHHMHWRTVKLKNSRIVDWMGFTTRLRRSCTLNLDMRKMLFAASPEETWNRLEVAANNLSELQRIDLGRCPARVFSAMAKNCRRLVAIDASAISTERIQLEPLKGMETLQELKIRGVGSLLAEDSWNSLATLQNLKHLCLTTFSELKNADLESLTHLSSLTALELGDCSGFEDSSQAFPLLSSLLSLNMLRLEEGPSNMDGLIEIQALSNLKNLRQLELVNFGMGNGLDLLLDAMPQLKRLLIIPEYTEQEETVKQTADHVMKSLKLAKDSEQVCWVLTEDALSCLSEGFVQEAEKELAASLPNAKVQIVTLQTYATNTYRLPALESDA